MDRNKPGYMNFADIADRLESGKLNAYDVVYTKDTHEVVFIKEDQSLIRMKCRLDVYPSVVVAEYYLNLNTDTYVGQIVGIEQGEWIRLYNVNYADNKFIVKKVGVDEYGQLTNKPQINGVTLDGNKTTEQLGINIPTRFSQLYDDVGYVTFDHLIENYYSKSQTYSKSEVDTALAGKADTNDIPTDLADLQDDSEHRTVTDENIANWNGKSNVVANPTETTEALNSIEINGVGYAVAGSGGGAVHSVNGKTGDVMLNASDVGALPDDTPLFSGDYNDLENKPNIPDDLADLHDDANHRTVTDAEKTQWNAAEANVQADWNQTTTSADDYIKNKPANLVQDANYVHTDNNFTNVNKTKLNDIEAGAEVNVQSDWNQTDSTQDDYIKNKPSIPDPQIQSDWNQTSGTAKDYIKNKPTLGSASALDVATSGDASATQVVKGDDSRLSDARTPVSHTHTLSEITDAGTAASKNSTSSVTADSTDLVESGAVKTAIDNAISGAYKHAGTKTCAELISSLLIASNNGNVYNMTDSGTTTADFIEGAGIPIRAGDNVGVAKVSDNTYKFDLLSGFIDTSNFVTKSSTSGLIKNDGSIDTTEYAPASSVPAAQIQSDWSQSDNTKLDYIKNKPTLGTASAKNVSASGDAGNSEVVLGNDSRLTDARNAADVYSWAKAENKPSYTKSEVGLGNVDNTSDATKKTNFTGSIASENTGFVTGGDAYTELAKKVDKVDGKGLSSNDYTTTEKDKLAGIATGAEVNVQSDWNQSDNTKDDYIKNKPANLVQDASYVHTDNNYTSDEKTKLSGIATGAEVNQNAFSNVKVGSTTIASGGKTATLELEAGSNVTLTPDSANKKVVLSATDTTYSDATTSVSGLMSASDKIKLNGIAANATKVESSETNGNIKIDDTETTVYDDTDIKNAIEDIDDIITTDETTIEGNPINFTTKSAQTAQSTIIDLEPIQDLHGYNYPWVGGAGKNKLDPTDFRDTFTISEATVTKQSQGHYKVNGSINGPYYIPLLGPGTGYQIALDLPVGNYTLSSGNNSVRCYIYRGENFTDYVSDAGSVTSTDKPITGVSFLIVGGTYSNDDIFLQLETGSTATDYESYENICPITGRTEDNILGCGKNLLKLSDDTQETTLSQNIEIVYSNSGATFTANGTFARAGYSYKTEIGKQYTLSLKGTSDANYRQIYLNNQVGFSTHYQGIELTSTETKYTRTFTADSEILFVGFYVTSSSNSGSMIVSEIQLEENSQDTPYEPYTLSNDINISFGDTVFGARHDVGRGLLVVDRGLYTVTGQENFQYYSASSSVPNRFAVSLSSIGISVDTTLYNNSISSMYEVGNLMLTDTSKLSLQSNYLSIADSRYDDSTLADFKTFITGLQICYPLATPITIELTPHQIALLEGVNNISTDGDKITLTYRDGKVATLGDVKALGDEMSQEIADSQILTDTVTGDKYKLVVTSGVLSIEQISN